MSPPWLLALATLPAVALLAWAYRRVRPARGELEEAVLQWAADRGHHVRRDDDAVEIVGARGDRRFTVALHPGPPRVLLLAVDCDADPPDGAAAATVQDGALVSRFTAPALHHLQDLDGALSALVDLAAEVERGHPLVGDAG